MNTTKLVAIALGMAFIASFATNIYLYSQNSNLNNELKTANSQNISLAQGTFIRNGTTFDEISVTLDALGNGTTIFFRNVAFTYIQEPNTPTNQATFQITFLPAPGAEVAPSGSSEILTVNDMTATTAKTSEVYTQHQGPRAGLGMNLDDASAVFLFVSIQYAIPP